MRVSFSTKKIGLLLGVVAVEFLFAGLGARAQMDAQENKPRVTSEARPKSQPWPDAKVPILSWPISLRDFPDMEPRVGLKGQLGYLTQFIQSTPVDGTPATERTEDSAHCIDARYDFSTFLLAPIANKRELACGGSFA